MIPVGPLHPEDAVYALGFGLVVGPLALGSLQRWSVLVTASAVAVMSGRHPGDMSAGFVERPMPWLVALAATSLALAAWWVTAHRDTSERLAALEAAAACAAVWSVVPDTEAPLIAGSVLVGAMAFMPRGGARCHLGLIWALPIAAAVIGSVGMPNRLVVAGLAAATAVVAVNAVQAVITRLCSRTARAGAPTTVVPAETSSTTTAPAPITAP